MEVMCDEDVWCGGVGRGGDNVMEKWCGWGD